MKKSKEFSPVGEIGRRLGRDTLPDGERIRPYYLGTVINLLTGAASFPMASRTHDSENTSGSSQD